MPLITGAFKSEMQELVTVAIRTTRSDDCCRRRPAAADHGFALTLYQGCTMLPTH